MSRIEAEGKEIPQGTEMRASCMKEADLKLSLQVEGSWKSSLLS